MYIQCVSQVQVEVLRMQDIYRTHMHFENPYSHSQSLKESLEAIKSTHLYGLHTYIRITLTMYVAKFCDFPTLIGQLKSSTHTSKIFSCKFSLAHLETSLYGTKKRKRVSMRNINVHGMYIYT